MSETEASGDVGVTLEQLVTILKQEEADASSFHGSDLAKAQEASLNAFYGRPYGDELDGRSRVVSRDVQETVHWIMPDLMRPFRSPDELIDVAASSPEDDAPGQDGKSQVDIAAAYLAHVGFKDNAGLSWVHDYAFDGLVQRIGWMMVAWETPKPKAARIIEGVQLEQLQRYVGDPEYEILEHEEQDGAFSLKVRHRPRMGRVRMECVPPEEMAFKRGTKAIKDAHYLRRKRRVFLAEVIAEFPEHRETLRKRKPRNDGELTSDGRTAARDASGQVPGEPGNTIGREQCDLIEEFIRIDFDGDGVVEMRHVKRVDDIVLYNEPTDWIEYVPWTPYRVSHKIDGLSLHDVIGDLQKIRTVITRHYLDGLSRTLTPTRYVNMSAISEQHGTLAALQSGDLGLTIPVDGDPRLAVQEAAAPNISEPALTGLDHFDRRIAEASGVTKQAQGMDPEAMNKTATGIDLLQAAAKTRIEMVATWLGMALEEVFRLVLQQLAAHQDGPRQVKLFGRWMPVDPSRWSDEAAVSVHVGTAGVSRHQRIANLGMIAAKQEQVLMTAGPQNPMVTLQHYRTTLAQMTGAMGFKDPTAFFGEIPEGWQPPEPGPDPKVAAEQAKLQLEQAKAQQTAQLDTQRMQFDQQKQSAEFEHKTGLERMKLESEREIAMLKLQNETQLAQMRMQFEQQLAEQRMQAEMKMAERQQSHREEQDKINGMRPGGRLDA